MKSLRIYIIVISALLIMYVIAQYNRPKAVDWTETLSCADKIPFGTYIVYNRLTDIFPNAAIRTYREPVYNVITDHGIKNAAYIIISDNINLNEYDYTKLTQFVRQGNDVFIASSYFGDQFNKALKITTASVFIQDNSKVNIRFLGNGLDTSKYYEAEKGMNYNYFSSLDTQKVVTLGGNNQKNINFIKYSIGKGVLYLNANPLMFSNFSLLNKQDAAYASAALSFLKVTKTVIWDQYYTQGREDDDDTMRFFLRNPPLKWAFYIAFFSLLTFVLFEVKRRQRIIPVIEPLKNSTLDFVNVVGQVYYEQRNNQNICEKKILYFLEYIRTQYYLKTNKLDAEFIEKLVQKTGLGDAFAHKLVNHINYISVQPRVTDNELITLNQLIEEFYTQSK